MRQQEEEELGDAVQKFRCLGKVSDVFRHLGMTPGQVAELRHKMRVGQEPDIEDQISLERHPVLVAETDGRDQQVLVRIAALELLQNVSAQLMHVVARCINADVGQIADGIEKLSLRMNRAYHRLRAAQRMGTPGFGKATHQRRVGGVEKNNRSRKYFSYLAKNCRKTVEMLALAHI